MKKLGEQIASEQLAESVDPLVLSVDVVIIVSGKGFCIIDEINGKTYRITCQNGVLNTTEVV